MVPKLQGPSPKHQMSCNIKEVMLRHFCIKLREKAEERRIGDNLLCNRL
jgi:hypothetical protein